MNDSFSSLVRRLGELSGADTTNVPVFMPTATPLATMDGIWAQLDKRDLDAEEMAKLKAADQSLSRTNAG